MQWPLSCSETAFPQCFQCANWSNLLCFMFPCVRGSTQVSPKLVHMQRVLQLASSGTLRDQPQHSCEQSQSVKLCVFLAQKRRVSDVLREVLRLKKKNVLRFQELAHLLGYTKSRCNSAESKLVMIRQFLCHHHASCCDGIVWVCGVVCECFQLRLLHPQGKFLIL